MSADSAGQRPPPGPAGERLEALHDRLVAAVADLTSSEAWQRMLSTAARLPQYSANNVLLIASQRPDATVVAGFQTWQRLGRQVRRGERGIAILAPVRTGAQDRSAGRKRPGDPASTDRDPGRASAGPPASGPSLDPARPEAAGDPWVAGLCPPGAKPGVGGFRVVHVFDLAQTDGPDLPLPPTPELLPGAAPAGLYSGLGRQVGAAGFELVRRACGAANGLTDFLTATVVVAPHLTDAQATKTLAHELGHVLLHRPELRPAGLARPRAEVEAESVAYIVTSAHGLATEAYTVPYVTGWAGGDLTLLASTTHRVLRTARAVLEVTPPPPTLALPDRPQPARGSGRSAGRGVPRRSGPARAGALVGTGGLGQPRSRLVRQPAADEDAVAAGRAVAAGPALPPQPGGGW